MSRTRVKFCGITRVVDARAAAEAGADAIGLVFYAKSVRCVDAGQAQEIARAVPPFITRVGLFVNHPADEVERMIWDVGLDLLQFHGSETPEYCAAFDRPYVKAIAMRDGVDVAKQARDYADACGILLDTYALDLMGGTGKTFDWSKLDSNLDKMNMPVILAGGLNAANVADAIRQINPYAVDVSSGVEAEPGVKDRKKMQAFIEAVRGAQR